jgi:hypothetical protein
VGEPEQEAKEKKSEMKGWLLFFSNFYFFFIVKVKIKIKKKKKILYCTGIII